jgi:hypothetical protein
LAADCFESHQTSIREIADLVRVEDVCFYKDSKMIIKYYTYIYLLPTAIGLMPGGSVTQMLNNEQYINRNT